MDLKIELFPICRDVIIVYHSVVDIVEDDLEDAADAGGHGDPQVDLISPDIGDVFLGLCP